MDNLYLVMIEILSAALAFILVRFMIKPYRITGENRYLCLPLGFAFLGISTILMGASLFFADSSISEKLKWLQLFTGSYAFVFLAVTYFLSGRKYERKMRPLANALISLMLLALVFLFIVLFLPPVFALPDFKTADEYFRLFNMILALYITVHTLRSHASQPEPRTILAPLAYALLAFSQYSFLIWSLDSSFAAFAGGHFIRIASLLAFLFVSYKSIIAPQDATRQSSDLE